MKTEAEVRDEVRQILLGKKFRAGDPTSGHKRSIRIQALVWVLTGKEVKYRNRETICKLLGWDEQCQEVGRKKAKAPLMD